MTDQLLLRLRESLKGDLPGAPAQDLMAPSLRPRGFDRYDGSNPRSSGVMILLFPNEGKLHTVFMERTAGGPHGGQISLPGGKKEKSDPDLIFTAKRETEEEVGVKADSIREIGRLSPLYVPHSNYLIQPVIGYLKEYPVFRPDGKEVASLIITPLHELFDPANRKSMVLRPDGMEITAPYYAIAGHRIWGATAMIVSEFEQVFISCISG